MKIDDNTLINKNQLILDIIDINKFDIANNCLYII